MAIVVFSVQHEDNSYSPMAVVKDNGDIISPNPRLEALLKSFKSMEGIEASFNNGQSKVTGRFPEDKAIKLLEKAQLAKANNGRE